MHAGDALPLRDPIIQRAPATGARFVVSGHRALLRGMETGPGIERLWLDGQPVITDLRIGPAPVAEIMTGADGGLERVLSGDALHLVERIFVPTGIPAAVIEWEARSRCVVLPALTLLQSGVRVRAWHNDAPIDAPPGRDVPLEKGGRLRLVLFAEDGAGANAAALAEIAPLARGRIAAAQRAAMDQLAIEVDGDGHAASQVEWLKQQARSCIAAVRWNYRVPVRVPETGSLTVDVLESAARAHAALLLGDFAPALQLLRFLHRARAETAGGGRALPSQLTLDGQPAAQTAAQEWILRGLTTQCTAWSGSALGNPGQFSDAPSLVSLSPRGTGGTRAGRRQPDAPPSRAPAEIRRLLRGSKAGNEAHLHGSLDLDGLRLLVGASYWVHEVLGVEPDAPVGRLVIAPRFPPEWRGAAVRNLRIGDARVNLSLERDGGRHLFRAEQVSGPAPLNLVIAPGFRMAGMSRPAMDTPGGRQDLESGGGPREAAVIRAVRIDGRPATLDLRAEGDWLVAPAQIVLDHARTLEFET